MDTRMPTPPFTFLDADAQLCSFGKFLQRRHIPKSTSYIVAVAATHGFCWENVITCVPDGSLTENI
jgi:hypothetical protein